MAYRPFYTPSAAFDDTRLRDAGHDDMQACLHRWLDYSFGADRRGIDGAMSRRFRGVTYELIWLGLEHMLTIEGRVVGFVDVMTQWRRHEPYFNQHQRPVGTPPLKEFAPDIYELYEVKPTIGQAGGLLRQLRVMQHIADKAISGSHGRNHRVVVTPVVPAKDPKLAVFSYMWRSGILTYQGDPMAPDPACLQSAVDDEFKFLRQPYVALPEWVK